MEVKTDVVDEVISRCSSGVPTVVPRSSFRVIWTGPRSGLEMGRIDLLEEVKAERVAGGKLEMCI